MCSEEPIFVDAPQSLICVTRRCKNVQEKVLHINSKPKLTEYHKFYSLILRNEHERPVLSPRFDEPHSITYFAMQRRRVCAQVKPSPRKNVPVNLPIFSLICVSLT